MQMQVNAVRYMGYSENDDLLDDGTYIYKLWIQIMILCFL